MYSNMGKISSRYEKFSVIYLVKFSSNFQYYPFLPENSLLVPMTDLMSFDLPSQDIEGLLGILFCFDLLHVPARRGDCPPCLISPPPLLLVVVMLVGVMPVAEATTFSGGMPTSDDIINEFMLPDIYEIRISFHGCTARLINGDLWLRCAFYLAVFEYQ